jgi:predicted DCC family thiol-disulfide oxidoreductase YuxK|tara:strand:- start:404 stop:766 length:363 start_codon:yes stop_codon:yes gene_type:complete
MDTLLLDGACGLCNRGALFLQARISPKKSLRILPIESEEGQKLIANLSEKQQDADTVYLFKNGKPYIRSAAIVRLSNYLRWWWKPMSLAWLIPLPIRDIVYRFIAKRRKRWFAAPDSCVF